MIPDLLETKSTLTGIAYAHLKEPLSRDYMGYVRHVVYATRHSKIRMWLGKEYRVRYGSVGN